MMQKYSRLLKTVLLAETVTYRDTLFLIWVIFQLEFLFIKYSRVYTIIGTAKYLYKTGQHLVKQLQDMVNMSYTNTSHNTSYQILSMVKTCCYQLVSKRLICGFFICGEDGRKIIIILIETFISSHKR